MWYMRIHFLWVVGSKVSWWGRRRRVARGRVAGKGSEAYTVSLRIWGMLVRRVGKSDPDLVVALGRRGVD
jgi:hypothetical protein